MDTTLDTISSEFYCKNLLVLNFQAPAQATFEVALLFDFILFYHTNNLVCTRLILFIGF